MQSKSPLEDLLIRHEKHSKRIYHQKQSGNTIQSSSLTVSFLVKYQQKFLEIYRTSSIQLRAVEQQRLLAIREQMRFAIQLTLFDHGITLKIIYSMSKFSFILDEHQLFLSNNFDELLNIWENQNTISIDHWTHFPHRSIRSSHEISFNLLDEIKQAIEEYFHPFDPIESHT